MKEPQTCAEPLDKERERHFEDVFCDFTSDVLNALDGIKTVQSCPRGTVLFRESQPARSIFLLCEGRVRLSLWSENGDHMTLRFAAPGAMLGLSAGLAGGSYEVTAEALDNLRVAAVYREDLLRFLGKHAEICRQVVNALSQELHVAYDRVRTLGLGHAKYPWPRPVH